MFCCVFVDVGLSFIVVLRFQGKEGGTFNYEALTSRYKEGQRNINIGSVYKQCLYLSILFSSQFIKIYIPKQIYYL